MSNYTVITDWDGKDALADSDPAKVISGDEFQDEFDAVATAVATKADINGSTTEAFSASTAAAGTNTTQVATTAFVKTAIDNAQAYPVGAVFISVVSTNPATLLGYGTWTAFATGKMLIGIDSGDTDFDTVEETGGAKTHTLTESEMPSHRHIEGIPRDNYGSDPATYSLLSSGDSPDSTKYEHYTGYTGGTGATETSAGTTQAHENMPPYIVTYMWKRTA